MSEAGAGRRRLGLACSEDVRRRYVDAADLARLAPYADFAFRPFSVGSEPEGPTLRDAGAEERLAAFAADLDVLVICHGAPFVSGAVLDRAPRLTLLAELDGDRFAHRLDLVAAHERGLAVVDTSHASSLPTAEWALGLALVGLRNAGALYRRMISHQQTWFPYDERSGPGYDGAELSHKRVGLIGFGHLGRRLMQLLSPFAVEASVYDPFAPRELAEVFGVSFAPLARVLEADVVFVLVPHTSMTEGMLGSAELERLRSGSVLVNVSRGKVIDSSALVARLGRGDLVACLDVFDPEPIPLDSPILDLPNVFVTPHVAGVTAESRRRFFSLLVDECLRHFAGLEPWNELTPQVVRLRS